MPSLNFLSCGCELPKRDPEVTRCSSAGEPEPMWWCCSAWRRRSKKPSARYADGRWVVERA